MLISPAFLVLAHLFDRKENLRFLEKWEIGYWTSDQEMEVQITDVNRRRKMYFKLNFFDLPLSLKSLKGPCLSSVSILSKMGCGWSLLLNFISPSLTVKKDLSPPFA